MKDKVNITLEFKDVTKFQVTETDVEVTVKTEDGGWKLITFPKEDVKSYYNYDYEN